MKTILKRIRGTLGNAVVWGSTWFVASFAYFTALFLAGGLPEPEPWRLILYVALNSGVTGFLAGGAFSIYLSRVYRNRDLMSISALRFGLGGAMTAGVLSSMLGAGLRLLAGVPLTGTGVFAAGMWGVLVGGITAFGIIKLAQRASREVRGTSGDLLGPGASSDLLGAGMGGIENTFGRRPIKVPTRS